MNLITDPWIPVLFENGTAELIGLEQLYRDAEILRDLNVNPPQRIALMRLLLCITQAALDGPENEEDWKTCRDRIIPESLAYLSTRKDKFDLYGDQPFLQAKGAVSTKEIKEKDKCSVDVLDQRLSCNNNHTLFDHGAVPSGRIHNDAWTALMLLTFQCFALGGGQSKSFKWKGIRFGGKEKRFEAAPCSEKTPLHMIFRGENILVTIHLNLLSKRQMPNWGVPIWDVLQADSLDSSVIESLGGSYLGRLVPLSRLVHCKQNSLRLEVFSQGFKYPKHPAYREPMIPLRLDKDESAYVRCSSEDEPWRELPSLISSVAVESTYLPLALAHKELKDDAVDIWTGGIDGNQAKPVSLLEWVFATYHGAVFKDDNVIAYTTGAKTAKMQANKLCYVVDRYCEFIGDELFKKKMNGKYVQSGKSDQSLRKKLKSQWRTSFWNKINVHSSVLLNEILAEEPDFTVWSKLVEKIANEAFEQSCPHETPRQIKAFVQAKKKLEIKEPKRG